MNLIRNGGAVYSTAQYETKQRKRRAHIKGRSHNVETAMNLIRNWGGQCTVQYETKQRKRRAHIKERTYVGGAYRPQQL